MTKIMNIKRLLLNHPLFREAKNFEIKYKAEYSFSREHYLDIYTTRLQLLKELCDFTIPHESDINNNRHELVKHSQAIIPQITLFVNNLMDESVKNIEVCYVKTSIQEYTVFIDDLHTRILGVFDF